MALTTGQLLLLNNLMYTYNSEAPGSSLQSGISVETFINTVDPSALGGENYMTVQDWQDIVTAVKSDPQLMRMEIAAAGASETGGFNAVLIDRSSHEAVVVFKGTQGAAEWRDNFSGGNTADTPCQKEALQWYQEQYKNCGLDDYSVTVTGHSKGGNKAKYVTLMNGQNTVDRCVSFDGQGFSDEFFEEHGDMIAQRQHLIENHNVDGDYVNILLNDVGERYYYKGQNLGNGGNAFLENHCPNSFFRVGENGELIMEQAPQSELMVKADELFNGMLRSMPDGALKETTLMLVADLVIAATGKPPASADYYIGKLFSPENAQSVAYFVNYALKYGEREALETLLDQIGLGNMMPAINIILDVKEAFHRIPAWIWALGISGICWFLEKILGIELPNELLMALVTTEVHLHDGADRTVESKRTDYKLKVDGETVANAADALAQCAASASDTDARLAAVRLESALGSVLMARVREQEEQLRADIQTLHKLSTTLRDIGEAYSMTERAITGSAG